MKTVLLVRILIMDKKEETKKKIEREEPEEPDIAEGLELDHLDACHSGKCAV